MENSVNHLAALLIAGGALISIGISMAPNALRAPNKTQELWVVFGFVLTGLCLASLIAYIAGWQLVAAQGLNLFYVIGVGVFKALYDLLFILLQRAKR